MVLGRPVDVFPDLGDNGGAECDVGHKVAVPFAFCLSAQLSTLELSLFRDPMVCPDLGSYGEFGVAYMISTWSQSAPWSIVRAQSAPSCAKSADRIDGAMIAFGAIFNASLLPLLFLFTVS